MSPGARVAYKQVISTGLWLEWSGGGDLVAEGTVFACPPSISSMRRTANPLSSNQLAHELSGTALQREG